MGLVKSEWSSMVDQRSLEEAVEEVCALSEEPLDAIVLGCSAFRVCVPGFISNLEEKIGACVLLEHASHRRCDRSNRWLWAPVPRILSQGPCRKVFG